MEPGVECMNTPPRLNILRLPSQMIITTLLIALVILGGLAALGLGRADQLFPLLAVGLLLISLRGLLTWPDDERARCRLAPAAEQFAPLQARIDMLSAQVGLPRVPQLLIAPDNYDLRVFGSWKRWYIGLDHQRALTFLEMAADPARVPQLDAALTHELFHFRHNDNLWIEYTRALLRNGLSLILWFGLLIVGMVWLAGLAQATFFANYSPNQIGVFFDQIAPGQGVEIAEMLFISQEQFEQLRAEMVGVSFGQAILNIVFNILSFLLVGGVLLAAFWRRFMQLREVYADAGVAQTRSEIASLVAMIVAAGGSAKQSGNPVVDRVRAAWRRFYNRHLSSVLELPARLSYLHHPELVYGSAWSYGWLVGLFVNFLNLVLLSTAAFAITSSWPLHFLAVAGLILLTLYLLPPLAVGGRSVAREVWVILGLIVGIYAALVLLVLALMIIFALIDPVLVALWLETALNIMFWYSGAGREPLFNDPWSVIAQAAVINLLHLPTLLLAIGAPAAALVALIRRMLTWYGLPLAETRLMRAVVLLILLMGALLGFVALPPLTDLILPRAMLSLPSPWYWMGAGLTLVVAAGFAAWFLIQDRSYAGRCPHCGKQVAGEFRLGQPCPHCGAALHPWLEAHYSVEPPR